MRKLHLALCLIMGLLALPAHAANFSAKDASAATIVFNNPGNCTTGCTPIFSWSDSTGTNLVAVVTAGADAQSNTANGGLTYGRNLVFNGTTWDRWTGAVTQSGTWNITNISGTVSLPTGASTSANQASQLTQETATAAVLGTTADSVCGSATGTCTLAALVKYLNNAVTASIPAGPNLIGDVNLRQGGTALSATNPTFARPTDGTNARVFDPCEVVAHVTTPINISTAATSVIVAGTASKKTYICSMMLFSAGTTNVGIVQGSGSTCGTSTLGLIGGATAATGPNLTAQSGFVAGNGNFAVAGTTVNANDVCLINGSAIQVSGYIVTATP